MESGEGEVFGGVIGGFGGGFGEGVSDGDVCNLSQRDRCLFFEKGSPFPAGWCRFLLMPGVGVCGWGGALWLSWLGWL